MPRPAKIALGVFGAIIAIIVIAGVANGGSTTAASGPAPSTRTTTPSATPAPTTSAAPAALTADDRFTADVLDSDALVVVGRSICGSIGVPGVTHANLVGELATPKWGAALAEVVVTAAERSLCPERRYAIPAVASPAPVVPDVQPEPEPAPAPDPGPRESPSSAYYKNCDAARAAGAAPLRRGESGYRAGLDRDEDGVACE